MRLSDNSLKRPLKTLGFGALYPLKALVTCGNLSVPFKNRLALHPFLTIGTLGTLKTLETYGTL